MSRHLLFVLLTWIPLAPTALAADSLPPGFDAQRHMRVSEVKDGMTGYGLSVFKGSAIERFDVEVLSVLRNFNPKDDVVLIRMKGANLEHTGPVAGMSGSPIYLKDDRGQFRLIGAFAYGWSLMKDPLGGVQPIENMLTIPAVPRKGEGATRPAAAAQSDSPRLSQTAWQVDELLVMPWKKQPATLNPLVAWNAGNRASLVALKEGDMHLRPLAMPLMASGLSRKTLDQFEPVFRSFGLSLLQAGGAASPPATLPAAKLEPGSAIAIPLMTGDVNLTPMGTCTEILGDRVLAFGHSFFGEGDISLPMSAGYINGVIPTLSTSFKLGASAQTVGTFYADQVFGCGGRLGPTPVMVPIELRCLYADGSVDLTYRFSAASHPRLTPVMMLMAMSAATSTPRDLPEYHTLDYDLAVEFTNGQSLKLQNRLVNSSTVELFVLIGSPLMLAAENPFERVGLKKLSGTLRVTAEARQADILAVSMPKSKFTPGQTIKAFVTIRPFRANELIVPVEFELPRNLPDGTYEFAVTDWQQHMLAEQATRPFRFTAQNAREVFDVMRDVTSVRHDSLYLRLTRREDGVAIGRTAMPLLPSSRRRVLLGAGLSNTTAFISSTVKAVPSDYVMTGGVQFAITIDRELKVEGGKRPGRAEPGAPGPVRVEQPSAKTVVMPDAADTDGNE